MSQPAKGPKFGAKKDEKEKPKTEAEVIARSAEHISRGGKAKTGRPPGPEPAKNIGISLPIRLIEALDKLAAERTGRNRSLALVEVLEGRLELPKK